MDKDRGKDNKDKKEGRDGKWEVSDHELVPCHEIISQKEVTALLKEYDIEKEKLPKLLSTDPVAKEIGAKVNDIVRITRKSSTSGVFIAYRLVML